MSYVAPRFCVDRVMPYPREGAVLTQATDCSNPQHNLFHLDFVFANTIYGMTVLKKNVAPDFNGYRLISTVDLATYQVTVGSGGLFHFTNGFPSG